MSVAADAISFFRAEREASTERSVEGNGPYLIRCVSELSCEAGQPSDDGCYTDVTGSIAGTQHYVRDTQLSLRENLTPLDFFLHQLLAGLGEFGAFFRGQAGHARTRDLIEQGVHFRHRVVLRQIDADGFVRLKIGQNA